MNNTPWLGPGGQVMRRLELHLTYTCPERCVFCSEAHRMAAFERYRLTWPRVATVLRKHASRGVRSVHFTGGEPTIHKHFVRVLALSKKLGLRTSVGTIGTMLARPDFAARAMPLLDEALFSLHGPTAQVHDAHTRRPGSFITTTSAMRIAPTFNRRFRAFVNTVVTRDNVAQLGDTVALAASLGAELIVVSNLTAEGAAADDYARLAVPLASLAEVLPSVPDRAGSALVRFFGVPMCLLGPHRMLSNDLHWDPRVTTEWAHEPGRVWLADLYNWQPNRKRRQVACCQGCRYQQVCMGVQDRYCELWPTDALRPVP